MRSAGPSFPITVVETLLLKVAPSIDETDNCLDGVFLHAFQSTTTVVASLLGTAPAQMRGRSFYLRNPDNRIL
jgi:hypothetical protein